MTFGLRPESDVDYARAFERIQWLLSTASASETGQPILHMVTRSRKSAKLVVQIFVIVMPSVTCVDISTEVATLTGLGYSQTHRGVRIEASGSNAHLILARSLGHCLYGYDIVDPLHYRSI